MLFLTDGRHLADCIEINSSSSQLDKPFNVKVLMNFLMIDPSINQPIKLYSTGSEGIFDDYYVIIGQSFDLKSSLAVRSNCGSSSVHDDSYTVLSGFH